MKIKFAPQNIFKQILKWVVVPTFDLVIEYDNQGIVIVKRKIAPYKNEWALPGLRIYKGENIENTLCRIAKDELGLKINPKNRIYLGQYIGKFKTENQRQDLSTGFFFKISKQIIRLNEKHFSEYKIIKTAPKNMGAMYKFYIREYKKIVK